MTTKAATPKRKSTARKPKSTARKPKSTARKPKVDAARSRPAHRPTELTLDIEDALCEALRTGNYATVGCRLAGISKRTYLRWRERGRIEEERIEDGEIPRPDEADFLRFWRATKRAEAQAEQRVQLLIQNAMPTSWQAAMTYLERRHPDRWGRRERHEISGPDGGAIEVRNLDDTERIALMAEARDELDRRLKLVQGGKA